MAMPEGWHSSHQSLIPAFKLFEDTLFRIVIPSAVEGSFLHSGQDHISTVRKDALVLCISPFIHPSFIGLQGRFLASLEMTIRESDV